MSALPPHPNVIGLVGISPMPPSVALVTKYCSRCGCPLASALAPAPAAWHWLLGAPAYARQTLGRCCEGSSHCLRPQGVPVRHSALAGGAADVAAGGGPVPGGCQGHGPPARLQLPAPRPQDGCGLFGTVSGAAAPCSTCSPSPEPWCTQATCLSMMPGRWGDVL